MSLSRQLGVLDRPNVTMVAPQPAGEDLLTLVHDPAYLEVVRVAPTHPWGVGHGFESTDNPVFAGMYEASALITGGSVLAAERVWSARASTRSTSPAACTTPCGRARPGSASSTTRRSPSRGCCELGAERIAYVDVDVHHGDGVQAAFYGDPQGADRQHPPDAADAVPRNRLPGRDRPRRRGGESVNIALPATRTMPAGTRPSPPSSRACCGRSGRRSSSPSPGATPTTRTRSPSSRSPSTASAATTRPCTSSRTSSATAAGSRSAAAGTGWSAACRGRGRTCSPR